MKNSAKFSFANSGFEVLSPLTALVELGQFRFEVAKGCIPPWGLHPSVGDDSEAVGSRCRIHLKSRYVVDEDSQSAVWGDGGTEISSI